MELRKKLRDGLEEEEEEGTTKLSQTGVQLPHNALSKVTMMKGKPKHIYIQCIY